MVVDLVAKAHVANLVEPLKAVEVCRKPIRHHHSMEKDGKASLAEGFDLPCLPEEFRSGRNQQMLPVVGIDICCEKAFDGSCHLSVEPVDENGFEYGSFKENVSFARCRSRCARRRGNRAPGFLLSCFLRGKFRCRRSCGGQGRWRQWF